MSVHERCDQIRRDRGLPDHILFALLADMELLGRRASSWPCRRWWSIDLGCPHGGTRRTGCPEEP